MNKLLILPLAFMYLVSIFVFLVTAIQPSGSSIDLSDSGQIEINETGSTKTGDIQIPSGGSQSFNLWQIGGIMAVLLLAISLGIVASIGVLGSGLGSLGENIIFNSILFLGIWACLTVVSSELMFDNMIMTIVYMVMTMMFVTGLGMQMSGGNDE